MKTDALLPVVSSAIRDHGNVPTLFINDIPVPGLAYLSYFEKCGNYRDFRKAGYRLYSLTVYFGDQGINSRSGIKALAPGFFEKPGKGDFSHLDNIVNDLLHDIPDALIFLRVNTAMPQWWEDENPNECNDIPYPGTTHRRSCPASAKYFADTQKMLDEFITYLKNTPYVDHIFGLQLAGGNTEEWLCFDGNGNIGQASRDEFARRYPGKSFDSVEFKRFLSIIVGENLCKLARYTKEATGGKWVVGTFFGYTFETPQWEFANQSLRLILDSPDIDFICSPASYIHRNETGYAWPCMLPLESLKFHKKLYFYEYDSRTHLSKFLPECHPGYCPEQGNYTLPVWLGPSTEKESICDLQMNFVNQMAQGCASWWFDLWGGWYDSPAIMAEMGRIYQLSEKFLNDADRSSVSQCAAYIDEGASAYNADGSNPRLLTRNGRTAIGQSGIPVDHYEIGDLAATAEKYKCVYFFVTARTPALEEAEGFCRDHHIPFMEFTADTEVAAAAVRDFAVANGAFCYCSDMDASVYVSENMIAVRALQSGRHTVQLPEVRQLEPIIGKGQAAVTDHFVCDLEAGEVLAFRMV